MQTRIRWIAVLMLFSGAEAGAEQPLVFLNPGVKMAYTFGAGGGFTLGPEVSLTYWAESLPGIVPGFVLGSYSCSGRVVFYFGPQVTGPGTVGFGMSVALVSEQGRTDIGMRMEVFGLFVAMPEYGHVFRKEGREDLNEIGLYLKLPVLIGGRIGSLGG